MATLIKLTYTQNGKVSLVNIDKMNSAFRIFERNTRKYATRLNFDNDMFIIVNEELQEIQQLSQEHLHGDFQSCDWVDIDNGGIQDQMEDGYNGAVQPKFSKRVYQEHRY